MTSPPKAPRPEGTATGRRSTRISIAIPITISGKDATGRPFKENTRTIILNKHGAKIVTVHQLALGGEILLENRALGRAAKTTVAWLGDPPTPREPAEVGIQLVEAENIWGIELPPDDWQEGPPQKEARKAVSPAAPAPAAAKTAAAPAAGPAVSPAAAPAPPRSTEVPVHAAPKEPPSRAEKEADRATQQKFGEMQQQLAAARAETETLHARIRELQKLVQSETERSQQEIRAAGIAAVQSASEELNRKLGQGLETIDAKVKEHSEQLTRQMNSTREELKSQSESLLEEAQARLTKALLEIQEKAPGALRESLERTSKEFAATLSKDFQIKASSSLGPLLDELNEAGRKAVEDARKQLSALGQQTRSGLEKEALKLSEEQNARLRKELHAFQDQESREIENAVKGVLEKRREDFLRQFQEQLEQTFKDSREKGLAEFRQSIRDELLKQFEEAAGEFDKRTQENVELFTDQLNEKKEEIVAQATEMFRSKIGQMFSAPQASAAQSSEGKGGK